MCTRVRLRTVGFSTKTKLISPFDTACIYLNQSVIEQFMRIDVTPLTHLCVCLGVYQIDTKGLASSIVSSGADTTSNLFRKFKDTTSSAIDKTKSKTDQVSDSATHQAQAAWQDTKTTTKEVASKTKQKANQAAKNAQHSANFLGKQAMQ